MKADYGTPELQRKRLEAVVNPAHGVKFDVETNQFLNARTGKKIDPTASETALGQMAERGFLHPEISIARRMADAGHMINQLWRVIFPRPQSCVLAQFIPSSNGEIDTERAKSDLTAIRAYLKNRALYDAVIDASVYNKWPKQTTPKYEDSFISLRTGLSRVMEWQRSR